MQINIDYSRDQLLSEVAIATLKDRYMLPTETSPQEAFARAAIAFADDEAHAQRIYDYASQLWFMYSTPILSNGGTERGMPIACFGGYVPDSRGGLLDHYSENAWLSSMGGGIGGFWGHVRSDGQATSKGSKSTGTIPFIKVVDSQMLAFSQGSTRRGSYAAYMDISHPEIEEFISIRKPTGGDMNRKSLNLNNAVCIPDSFMRKVVGQDTNTAWDLVDPHSGEVVRTVDAIELWRSILDMRLETGEPYIMFSDTVNAARPQVWKDKGLTIYQSNLCSEITLPTNAERTFVCCLSSLNLEKYDDWKDTTIVEDLVRFLDNVITWFIDNAPAPLAKAIYSASQERSLGIGAMGFHSYLQNKGIPFEGVMAKVHNLKIFDTLYTRAKAESKRLATERGEAPDMVGTGMRNAQLFAIAPNATSSLIAGTSPGIEPLVANTYLQKTLSGSFRMKNPALQKVLASYGQDTAEVWKDINAHDGSVQHLEFLTNTEKDVFRTAHELNQHWLIEHAADRQPYICQAQSLNLFFAPKQYEDGVYVDMKEVERIHLLAWAKKLKTLYYLRSRSVSPVENIEMKIERKFIGGGTQSPVYEETTCLSCES